MDDLDALVGLERRCHSHPWSARGLRDALAPGSARRGVFVLRAPWTPDEAERGIRAYCAIEVVADEVHVHNLAVTPEARRQGLARRLLALALGIAARQGAAVARTWRCATATRPPARCTGRWASPRSAAATRITPRPPRTRSSSSRAGPRLPNLEKPPVPVLTSRAWGVPPSSNARRLASTGVHQEQGGVDDRGTGSQGASPRAERGVSASGPAAPRVREPSRALHGEGRPQRRRAGRGDDAQEEEASASRTGWRPSRARRAKPTPARSASSTSVFAEGRRGGPPLFPFGMDGGWR